MPTPDRGTISQLSFDPYNLMPAGFPGHPRTVLTPERIARTRRRIGTTPWIDLALRRLIAGLQSPPAIPAEWRDPKDPSPHSVLTHAVKCAIAHALTADAGHRADALRCLRAVSDACPRWSVAGWPGMGGRPVSLTSGDLRIFAQAYDLLSSSPLTPDDDARFRRVLTEFAQGLDTQAHYTCGNYSSWNIVARLTVAAALGDRQTWHDAMYGCARGGYWRYGLAHQVRHDILADGLHWERTLGYHYYSLMALTEVADLAASCGVDVWRMAVPALMENDGSDIHRDYGPEGTKRFKDLYDAPFYQMFANGDFPLLHDSGLANVRGTPIWGPLYHLAYQAYRDPKYAWLVNRVEAEHPDRKVPGLPMPLHTWAEYYDFLRIEEPTWPDARFDLAPDADFGITGRHRRGCSLFPAQGSAVLRADPRDERAPSAFIFFGPHSAGHQAPAALHLDLHAGGCRRTDAPAIGGYDDPRYPTWARTTIAHNTVTVDEASMFPYDRHTDSIWEADVWHQRVSDGRLELFQPDAGFHAVRAANEHVYPGVRLDRTVVLTAHYALDVFRVLSEVEHQYDWAMHIIGTPDEAGGSRVDPGRRLGYRMLSHARQIGCGSVPRRLRWRHRDATTDVLLATPPAAAVLVADDPEPAAGHTYGDREPPAPRTSLIVRVRGSSLVFVSAWVFDGSPGELSVNSGEARGPIEVTIASGGDARRYRAPYATEPVRVLG